MPIIGELPSCAHSFPPVSAIVRPFVRPIRPIALAFPVAECIGADHPHSAEISSPTPTIRNWAPTEVDYDDYRDVLEGIDDGPSDEDWADYGQWVDGVRADRQEREYEEQELSEMRVRHGVIDCYA